MACNTDVKSKEVSKQKTNRIYILLSDLGYGDLKYYVQKNSNTMMDKMAAEGTFNRILLKLEILKGKFRFLKF